MSAAETVDVVPDHPAKFSAPVLAMIHEALAYRVPIGSVILDPFAGVGGIHEFERGAAFETWGVELEPEWAAAHPRTVVGDSTRLAEVLAEHDIPTPTAIVTSPAYGNRMADSYAGDARGTKRFTYRIALGRPLSDGNGGGMQWGNGYRDLHAKVWEQCVEVLAPGGWMVVNLSNHVRAGALMPVVEWHLETLIDLGLYVDEVYAVATRRMRFGENHELRAATEKVLVLQKPGVSS